MKIFIVVIPILMHFVSYKTPEKPLFLSFVLFYILICTICTKQQALWAA